MSKARDKGTRGENYFLASLRIIWPTAERAPLKGTLDAGDYVNVPFPVEAKNTAKPLFLAWVRRLKVIVARDGLPNRWVLIWTGDRRTLDGQALMVLPESFGWELLAHWEATRLAERAGG